MSERSSSMEWQLEGFEIRTSLWRLIEEFVPESERLEIKEALGEDLVDETLDLQNEVSSYFRRYMYSCTCMVRLIPARTVHGCQKSGNKIVFITNLTTYSQLQV